MAPRVLPWGILRPVLLASAIVLVQAIPTAARADVVVETNTGERLLLRSDGTYYRLPPEADRFGRIRPRDSTGVGVSGRQFQPRDQNDRGSAGFDQRRYGAATSGMADGGQNQGRNYQDPAVRNGTTAYGEPGASPDRAYGGGQYDGGYGGANAYEQPPPPGFYAGPMASYGSSAASDLPGYGGAAPYGDTPQTRAYPLGSPDQERRFPGQQMVVPLAPGSVIPRASDRYERVQLAELWKPEALAQRDPHPAMVELRGWISTYGKLDQAMLFPTRNVTWDYTVMSGDRLPPQNRKQVIDRCRGVCEVLVQGKVTPARDGRPQIQAHRISVLN